MEIITEADAEEIFENVIKKQDFRYKPTVEELYCSQRDLTVFSPMVFGCSNTDAVIKVPCKASKGKAIDETLYEQQIKQILIDPELLQEYGAGYCPVLMNAFEDFALNYYAPIKVNVKDEIEQQQQISQVVPLCLAFVKRDGSYCFAMPLNLINIKDIKDSLKCLQVATVEANVADIMKVLKSVPLTKTNQIYHYTLNFDKTVISNGKRIEYVISLFSDNDYHVYGATSLNKRLTNYRQALAEYCYDREAWGYFDENGKIKYQIKKQVDNKEANILVNKLFKQKRVIGIHKVETEGILGKDYVFKAPLDNNSNIYDYRMNFEEKPEVTRLNLHVKTKNKAIKPLTAAKGVNKILDLIGQEPIKYYLADDRLYFLLMKNNKLKWGKVNIWLNNY